MPNQEDKDLIQAVLGEVLDMQQEDSVAVVPDPNRITITRPKLNIVYINHEPKDKTE